MKKIQCYSNAALREPDTNEDAFRIGQDFAIVCDGATSLTGKKHVRQGLETDAKWIAKRTVEEFKTIVDDCVAQGKNHVAITKNLNTLLRQEFSKYGAGALGFVDQYPSTTLSAAYRVGENIHILQVGDSPIVVRTKDKKMHVFEGDQVLLGYESALLDVLNNLKYNQDYKRASLKDKETLIREAWEGVETFDVGSKKYKSQGAHIRNLMNKPDGYGVISLTEGASNIAAYEVFNADEVTDIILMSDGITDLKRFYAHIDIKFIADQILQKKTKLVVDLLLKELQVNSDHKTISTPVPLFKFLGDDITILHARP